MKLFDTNKDLFAVANLQNGIYELRMRRHVPVECAYQARTCRVCIPGTYL